MLGELVTLGWPRVECGAWGYVMERVYSKISIGVGFGLRQKMGQVNSGQKYGAHGIYREAQINV